WHENGEFDLPTMIDYILNETRREQLYYAGHSMGTTAFFVMASVRPEYNRKIRVMCALSSVTFMNHMESPIIRNIAWTNRGDEWLLNALGIYEFLPNNEIIDAATRKACQDNAPTQEVCSNVMFLIAGWDSQQLNKTQLPVILSHFPGGASTKQILHYAQEVVSGQFRQWDYGVISNTYFYGSSKPPNYNLTRVTAPVAIFYSDNDWLSNIIDVKRLQALLTRSVVRMIKVPWNKFNHLDYMWAIDAKRLVYDTVIQTFREYPL
ncbi:Lipase 3, partial [Gryllus bimaculatus]